jgi:DNA processing protein
MNDIHSLVALSLVGAGAAREFAASPNGDPWQTLIGLREKTTSGHIAKVYGSDPFCAASAVIRRCQDNGYAILTLSDELYPELLRQIDDPPLAIYCKGNIPRARMVSIVGTRQSDQASESVARKIALDCARASLCVVSGMALGIDRASHCGALEGGSTVAVLPHGIDIRYPVTNNDLFVQMERSPQSAIISEFPPGIRCYEWTFVRRNRIISGLSRATIVVKAGMKSGAMITARFAADQGRDVFACGGLPFDEGYDGCRKLINDGAMILSHSNEILAFYGLGSEKGAESALPLFPTDETGEKILILLNKGVGDIDTIVRGLSLSASEVRRSLVLLELEGFIRLEGGRVFRTRGA